MTACGIVIPVRVKHLSGNKKQRFGLREPPGIALDDRKKDAGALQGPLR